MPTDFDPNAMLQHLEQMRPLIPLLEFILLLLVAALCGAIGRALVGYESTGCLASMGLGFIGALLGTAIARAVNLPEIVAIRFYGQTFPIIWSIIGATLCSAVLARLTRHRKPADREATSAR